MHQLFILHESATGFALFRTTEFEEIGVFIPQVRESIQNISKFRSNVFLIAYQAFADQKNALQNFKCISAGNLSNDLQLFLENNIPRTKKSKQPIALGVVDPDLAAAISNKLNIKCVSTGNIMEITRGIRFHFDKLLKGFKSENFSTKSQLALGFSNAREKVNINAVRQDSMIIESNSLVEEFHKGINKLGKGIKARYSLHFPELHTFVQNDIELYVRCVKLIGDRKNMPTDIKGRLQFLLGDNFDVDSILTAAHSSMGSDISSYDLENLHNLSERTISLIERKVLTERYLKSKMNSIAPSLSSLVGEKIGSQLITRAGGLEKLAKLPASTVQVLGAEKKFFRTLHNRTDKVPISGLLSSSTAMKKSVKRKKGCMARILANKCSLAARVDCFSKVVKKKFGEQLLLDVDKCIKYSKKARLQK